MIPNQLISLDSFPLTTNGKIDIKNLPDPDFITVSHYNNGSDSLTYLEKELVLMWAKILKIEKINIDDNFFELGGHSLLAIHLLNSISLKFNEKIPLGYFFQFPTIRKLREYLETSVSRQLVSNG